jgi:excisionase family DNA binding protein
MASSFYRPPAAPTLHEPLALRPREAAASLGVSVSTLERLTASGEIGVVRLGRCRLYATDELKAWLGRNRSGGRVVGQEVAS